MDSIHKFEKEKYISFPNRTNLIRFVSDYLAHKYEEYLKFECATAMDEFEEQKYWEKKIMKEIPKLKKALRKLLFLKLMFNKQLEITPEGNILKKAFKKLRIETSPKVCFAKNVEYKIDNLLFMKKYRS